MGWLDELVASLGGQPGQGTVMAPQAPPPMPPPQAPPPQQGGGFGQVMGDIGSVLQQIGGHAIDALGIASAINSGNLGGYLAQQNRALDDPAFRQGLSPFRAGMYGQYLHSTPQGLQPDLPPLSAGAQAEQAKGQYEANLYQRANAGDPSAMVALGMPFTPQQQQAYVQQEGLGQPGGPARIAFGPHGATTTYGQIGTVGPYEFPTPEAAAASAPPGMIPRPTNRGTFVPWRQPPTPAPPAYGAPLQIEPPGVTPPGVTPQPAQPSAAAPAPTAAPPPEGSAAGAFVAGPGAPSPAPAQGEGEVPPGMTRMYIRPGTHVAQTPTGDVYSAPTAFSADGKQEMKVYDPLQPPPQPKQPVVSPNLMRAYASGIDPATNRPATKQQRTQGRAFVQQTVKEHRAKAEAASGARPMTAQTQETLATVGSVHTAATELRRILDDPTKQPWLGPLWGNAAWYGYQTLGMSPDDITSHFITLNELFKIESAGRLARLAGSRARAVWNELTIHPPHPGDQLSLIRSKLNDIDFVTREIGKSAAKLAGMPRDKAEKYMEKKLAEEDAAGGTPFQPGEEIVPGVKYKAQGMP